MLKFPLSDVFGILGVFVYAMVYKGTAKILLHGIMHQEPLRLSRKYFWLLTIQFGAWAIWGLAIDNPYIFVTRAVGLFPLALILLWLEDNDGIVTFKEWGNHVLSFVVILMLGYVLAYHLRDWMSRVQLFFEIAAMVTFALVIFLGAPDHKRELAKETEGTSEADHMLFWRVSGFSLFALMGLVSLDWFVFVANAAGAVAEGVCYFELRRRQAVQNPSLSPG